MTNIYIFKNRSKETEVKVCELLLHKYKLFLYGNKLRDAFQNTKYIQQGVRYLKKDEKNKKILISPESDGAFKTKKYLVNIEVKNCISKYENELTKENIDPVEKAFAQMQAKKSLIHRNNNKTLLRLIVYVCDISKSLKEIEKCRKKIWELQREEQIYLLFLDKQNFQNYNNNFYGRDPQKYLQLLSSSSKDYSITTNKFLK